MKALPAPLVRMLARAAWCVLLALGLGLSVFNPLPGQPAVLVPMIGGDLAAAITWSRHSGAPLLGIDKNGQAIVRLPQSRMTLAALSAGFLPLAADGHLCAAQSPDRTN